MNIRTGIKTGLAALTIATAPLTGAAKKTAQDLAADSVKVETVCKKVGDKFVTTTTKTNKNTGAFLGECTVSSTTRPAGFKLPGEPKDQEGVFRVGVDYSSRDILGLRTSEPRAKVEFDARSEKVYFRPSVAVGTESYNAVLPLGVQLPVSKNASIELGSDLAGVRGFHNGKSVFLENSVNRVKNGEDCKAHDYTGEFFQNLHVGARVKNDAVNASVRGEVGRTAYIGGGLINEAPGKALSEIEASGTPIVKAQSSGYVGARANVEVTPFKQNRNIAFNAEGAVSTNKGAEGSVGVAYKF